MYKWTLVLGRATAAGLLLALAIQNAPVALAEASPPRIIASAQTNGSCAPLNAPITAVFDQPMDPLSFSGYTVSLKGTDGSQIPGTIFITGYMISSAI